jgi:hypothetical protein
MAFRSKSSGLSPDCRLIEHELLRISRPNVWRRSADFEPQTRGNQAMTENDEPKYDSEAADDSVHLVAETQSPALVPDLPA